MTTSIEDYVRLLIAIVFLGVFAYLTVTGREITNQFTQLLVIVIGFYFGLNELGRGIAKIYASRTRKE